MKSNKNSVHMYPVINSYSGKIHVYDEGTKSYQITCMRCLYSSSLWHVKVTIYWYGKIQLLKLDSLRIPYLSLEKWPPTTSIGIFLQTFKSLSEALDSNELLWRATFSNHLLIETVGRKSLFPDKNEVLILTVPVPGGEKK